MRELMQLQRNATHWRSVNSMNANTSASCCIRSERASRQLSSFMHISYRHLLIAIQTTEEIRHSLIPSHSTYRRTSSNAALAPALQPNFPPSFQKHHTTRSTPNPAQDTRSGAKRKLPTLIAVAFRPPDPIRGR